MVMKESLESKHSLRVGDFKLVNFVVVEFCQNSWVFVMDFLTLLTFFCVFFMLEINFSRLS